MSYFVVFLFVSSSCFFISSFLSRFFDLSFHVKGLSGSVDEEDGGYWLFLVSVCVCVYMCVFRIFFFFPSGKKRTLTIHTEFGSLQGLS